MSNHDFVSEQEIDDIAKAIELSLRETSEKPQQLDSRLYPSTDITNDLPTTPDSSSSSEPRKVRALYDFEAAEDNELSFKAGEIIHVTDDSDTNWWKGFGTKGEGLFPSNFVTADLTVEPEKLKNAEELDKSTREKKANEPCKEIKIDEVKVDRLLQLLLEADPEEENDSEELLDLESEVNSMSVLVNQELEKVDRNYARLTETSADLVEALNLYHALMKEPYATSSYQHQH